MLALEGKSGVSHLSLWEPWMSVQWFAPAHAVDVKIFHRIVKWNIWHASKAIKTRETPDYKSHVAGISRTHTVPPWGVVQRDWAVTLLTTVAKQRPENSGLVWLQWVKTWACITLWGAQDSAARVGETVGWFMSRSWAQRGLLGRGTPPWLKVTSKPTSRPLTHHTAPAQR